MAERDGTQHSARWADIHQRRAAVAYYRQAGWTLRQISARLGWSTSTIHNDVHATDEVTE